MVSLIALSGVDIGIRDLQFQNQGMQLSNSVTPCILEIEIKSRCRCRSSFACRRT